MAKKTVSKTARTRKPKSDSQIVFTPPVRSEKNPSSATVGTHVSIRAGAGTGKTTTMELGYLNLQGKPLPFKPSDEQEAIIDSFRGTSPNDQIKFVCFNKSIANEFIHRGLPGCTNHSLGFAAVRKIRPRIRLDEGGYNVRDFFEQTAKIDAKRNFDLLRLTEKTVSLAKMTLCGWSPGADMTELNGSDETWVRDFMSMIDRYGLELGEHLDRVCGLTADILAYDARFNARISFDDMVWLPVVRDLGLTQYDHLIVDERQDLNRCQQLLLQKSCLSGRITAVGDKFQSIYGFAGADAEAFENMDSWMSSQPRGMSAFPLMKTRRCPKSVVELARTLVPEYESLPEAPEGRIVRSVPWAAMLGELLPTDPLSEFVCRPGDMILCRVNAPLVQFVYRLLRKGIRANIQGRDIGKGIVSLVRKANASTIEDLIRRCEEARDKELSKARASKYVSENRIQAIEDKYDCLSTFCEEAESVEQLIANVERIFQDVKDRSTIVLLSSVHRAKGLEAERVTILCPEKMPLTFKKMLPWQKQQENNIQYVAWTRTKNVLAFAETPSS